MINQGYMPPPQQDMSAVFQTIDANQQHQTSSPEQSAINDVNSGKYGEGFSVQNARDLAESIEGIGEGLASLGEASGKGEEVSNLNNALQGPGYTDHCDPPSENSGISSFRAAIEEKGAITSATDSSKSNNEGIASFREASSGQSAVSNGSLEQSSEQEAAQTDSSGESSGQGVSM